LKGREEGLERVGDAAVAAAITLNSKIPESDETQKHQ